MFEERKYMFFLLCLMVSVLAISGPIYGIDDNPVFVNLSPGKPVFCSSEYASQYGKSNANDGNENTVWGSDTSAAPQWIYIDLEKISEIDRVSLQWYDIYYAKSYQVYISNDSINWSLVLSVNDGNGGDDIFDGSISSRYVGIYCTGKNQAAYALKEFEILQRNQILTPTPTATPTPTPTNAPELYGGLRASSYGLGYPDKYWTTDICKKMANRFNAVPSIIWIVSTYGYSYTEEMLDYFDQTGVKVWLQVEPFDTDIYYLIDDILSSHSHHPSVIGFGVDVEWYTTDHGETGKKVTDYEAASWLAAIREHNEDYMLFLKHWDPEWMPPTVREGIMFLNDSQEFPSLDLMINETDPSTTWGVGFKVWGERFSESIVGYQYGYPADKKWWQYYNDPPKVIGDEILTNIPNTRYLFWVDFSVDDIQW